MLMRRFALLPILALSLAAWSAAPAAAQAAPVPAPSCLSDWSCTLGRAPLGLYVVAVDAGGRYVTLEDGSLWEVEISDRATTGSWRADDFVGLRTIAAPRGDFDTQLARVGDDEQRAAARLAGRRPAGFRSADSVPGGLGDE
jgi:hypothetical protein